MIDLSTEYLGFKLRSPLVVSSSPLCKDLTNLRRLEEAGAAAIVLHSLFEEQFTIESQSLDRTLTEGSDSYGEALSYFPDLRSYNIGSRMYLDHVKAAKKSVQIPIIGSLNGSSSGGWIKYAKEIEEAGADALELNIYFLPTNPKMDSSFVEDDYCDLVRQVKSSVKIPVAVKLGPFFTAMANMGARLDEAGADALVLFNRFYQPDFDLENLEVVPNLVLSDSSELRLRLHWVAILASHIRADLAITGGVHTAEDVVKSVMAGAHVTMMTSALLKQGIGWLRKVENDLREWMEIHEYRYVGEMRGAMKASSVAEPAAFERANYLKVLGSYTAKTA